MFDFSYLTAGKLKKFLTPNKKIIYIVNEYSYRK